MGAETTLVVVLAYKVPLDADPLEIMSEVLSPLQLAELPIRRPSVTYLAIAGQAEAVLKHFEDDDDD